MASVRSRTSPSPALLSLCLLLVSLSPSSALEEEKDAAALQQECRYKSRGFEPTFFALHSCAWCFQFLAKERLSDIRAHPSQPFLYVISNRTSFPFGTLLLPNVTNATDASRVCSTVSQPICQKWKDCCWAARDCCRRQVSAGPPVNGTCRRTWDGWGCWNDTAPGTSEYVSCPTFVSFADLSNYGEKTCRKNGTWVEWSDYSECIDKQPLANSLYLAFSCNAVSIVALVPALIIFLAYRSLRSQHRIRLHINFFTALLMANITSILWDVIVTYDRLTSNSSNTTPALHANGVGCKLLTLLRLYFKSTTYVWMFCEGFYLHRLISNAFRPPKSLIFLYASGWGAPLFYCVLYVILRGIYANDNCWAKSFGHLEWIMHCPNILCLTVNLFFLCNILRVLLTQLQTHPNEPSNFKRALKATFVLIPLFGVQLMVTIYRVPAGQPGASEYEMFTVFVTNSQGFFVALIFCFVNGEILRKVRRRQSRDEMNYYLSVIAQMKRTLTRHNVLRAGAEIISRENTLATSVHHRDEDSEFPAGLGGASSGSLLNHHHNGTQGPGGGGTMGSNGATTTGNHNGSYQRGAPGAKSYSYIPMKTMS